ncbi:MAG TPA: phosphotransferase [Streptosporangiaceae bacterium]|nr:phosphotransferase [Streptosporangiaceae bacterium]
MRTPPAGLAPERVGQALAAGWRLQVASMRYVPEGAGSYHWKLTDGDGGLHFVTVDDLDDKDWFGHARESVFDGLRQALDTAAALRHEAGLEFVVAPVAGRDGEPLRRIDDRYTVSVFPFLAGTSYPFGAYTNARLRDQALDMVAALHLSTAVVHDRAPSHVPGYGGREDLADFLLDSDRRWQGGPYSEAAHHLLTANATDLAELAAGFDELVDSTAPARARLVITHGEPHQANLMSVGGRLALVDWDTTAMAPPERDVSLIATARSEGIDRYEQTTGRGLDLAVIALYRLRWYLDDIASAIRLFRNGHRDTADTRLWWDGLAPRLEQLPRWLDLLSQPNDGR